jgi:hypothetical protein
MQFRYPFPAFPAARSTFDTFNGDDDFSPLSDHCLQNSHIRYIQGYRDLRFCHAAFRSFLPFISFYTPIAGGYHGNSPRTFF